jgi:general secretion pathway protein G
VIVLFPKLGTLRLFPTNFDKRMNKSSCIRLLYRLSILERSNLLLPNSSGFTLLEMLIVVIITGILSAIAFPNLIKVVDKFHYGEAKTKMNCMAKQAYAFKLENGYFPPDQYRDVKPVGIDCFSVQSSGDVPFNSKYDYDMRVPSTNTCYVQIVFLGKNGEKEVPNGSNALYPTAGIYEYSDIQASSDDLVFSLGTFTC